MLRSDVSCCGIGLQDVLVGFDGLFGLFWFWGAFPLVFGLGALGLGAYCCFSWLESRFLCLWRGVVCARGLGFTLLAFGLVWC